MNFAEWIEAERLERMLDAETMAHICGVELEEYTAWTDLGVLPDRDEAKWMAARLSGHIGVVGETKLDAEEYVMMTGGWIGWVELLRLDYPGEVLDALSALSEQIAGREG